MSFSAKHLLTLFSAIDDEWVQQSITPWYRAKIHYRTEADGITGILICHLLQLRSNSQYLRFANYRHKPVASQLHIQIMRTTLKSFWKFLCRLRNYRNCPVCNRVMGSNKDCPECQEYEEYRRDYSFWRHRQTYDEQMVRFLPRNRLCAAGS